MERRTQWTGGHNAQWIEGHRAQQSWARDNFLASRQRNIASGTSQRPEKNRKIARPQCLDGVATIKYSKMTITNNFVACGHIVATELWRAQLWCTVRFH